MCAGRSTPAISILAVYTVYFALFALLAQVIAVGVLLGRRRLRAALLVAGLGATALASLTPWILVARSQLSHGAGAFWVPKLSLVSLSGGLVQFFIGPPINSWVNGYAALRTLEVASVAAGVLALAALVINRRRLERHGGETASLLGLSGGIAIAAMVLVSFWHPLEDGRYLGSAWAPLFPLIGAGLATLPWRTVSFAAAAVTAAVAAATVTTITNPDTPAAVADLERSAGPHDAIAAYPSQYLLVLYYGDTSIDQRTRSMASACHGSGGRRSIRPEQCLHSAADGVQRRHATSGMSTSRATHRRPMRRATRRTAPAAGRVSVSPC